MLNWPVAAVENALEAALSEHAGGADAGGRPLLVEVLAKVDSSNSELMRRARAGRIGTVLLVVESQTAGRGRMGRDWHSGADDSLTFSVGLALAPQDWAGLSLAVGVALADALDPERKHGIGLKWPNDLWLRDRKLAGVLVETVACAGLAPHQRYAVIGAGINIAQRPADGLSTPPAWLREIAPGIDAPAALLRVAAPLLSALKAFETFGFAPFHARFDARDMLNGRPITAAGGSGDPLVGTAHGVAEDGALLVQTSAGMRAVTASDVSVRPARMGAA